MTKKRYVAPLMECEMLNEVLPLCLSGKVKSGGVIDDILFGGVDTGGDKEPSIKEMQDFNEEFGKLLW